MIRRVKATYAELYDRHLVPMLFAPYAPILAERAKMLGPREHPGNRGGYRHRHPGVGADLAGWRADHRNRSQSADDRPRQGSGPVWQTITWQQADAMKLPFPDASFDLIVCQFGVMFFPGKQASFREASRVLRQGGTYRFAVWDAWKKMPTCTVDHRRRCGRRYVGAGSIVACEPALSLRGNHPGGPRRGQLPADRYSAYHPAGYGGVREGSRHSRGPRIADPDRHCGGRP